MPGYNRILYCILFTNTNIRSHVALELVEPTQDTVTIDVAVIDYTQLDDKHVMFSSRNIPRGTSDNNNYAIRT